MNQIFLNLTVGMVFLISSCQLRINKAETKAEIAGVESEFQQSLAKNGVAFAFEHFADDSAIIKRENDTLIIGKAAIKKYYSSPLYNKAIATWKPDFIDISDDGTMAYTYGRYKWTFTDTLGKKSTYEGVFHTVWKKTEDGRWKYVWD